MPLDAGYADYYLRHCFHYAIIFAAYYGFRRYFRYCDAMRADAARE